MGKPQDRFPSGRLPTMPLKGICSRKRHLSGRVYGMAVRRFILIALFASLLLQMAGCGTGLQNDGISGGSANQAQAALPDGWTVYRPDDEFSSVLIAGDTVLFGGLNGLFALTADRSDLTEIPHGAASFHLVKALLADPEGRLWVGHQAGVTCLPGFVKDGRQAAPVPNPGVDLALATGQKVGMVNDFMLDGKGMLYAGTYNGALLLSPDAIRTWLKSGTATGFQWMAEKDGLTSPMVNAMLCDTRGDRWFGAYIARGGGVACFHDGIVQSFNHDSGLADDYVTTIAEDLDGAVWVGTGVYMTGGASRFVRRNGAYVSDGLLTRDSGLAGEKVRYIHIDRQGNRWFCSEYDGVAVFGKDGQRIRLLTKQEGLPDNEVKQMAEDAEGNLWFACRRGVLRIGAQAAGVVTKP